MRPLAAAHPEKPISSFLSVFGDFSNCERGRFVDGGMRDQEVRLRVLTSLPW